MATFSAWAGRIVGVGACAAVLLACVVDESTGVPSESSAGSGGSSGGSSSTGAPSTSPLLVDVDPNQTLTASPGQGVGVFVQYATGGHWNIWWTCDTSQTGLACTFQNTVTVSSGTITNVVAHAFETNDSLSVVAPQEVQASTYTTVGVDAITFDTPLTGTARPVITLEAKLSGQDNGSFLFFVQDGEINGGFKGTLTDPLELEPSSP